MSEAVKALTFEEWHNGQATCCKDCANNCPHIGWERVAWNASRAAVEREMVAMREPGPCGHPNACLRPATLADNSENEFICTVCAELSEKDEQSTIDEARKLAKLIKQNNRAEAFQWVCDKVLAVLDRKGEGR